MDEQGKPKPWKPKLWVPSKGLPMEMFGIAAAALKAMVTTVIEYTYKGPKPEGIIVVGDKSLDVKALEARPMAERMLETAERFRMAPKDALIISNCPNIFDVEFTAVCLKFADLPAATRLRAIVEGWDYNRIVQEVHR